MRMAPSCVQPFKATPEQLKAYLHRIGLPEALNLAPSLDTLKQIHSKHLFAIPFENLAIHYPPNPFLTSLGPRCGFDDVFYKLVSQRLGGWCFEQNTLLAGMLHALGYDLMTGGARIVVEGQGTGDGTSYVLSGVGHMVLFVQVEGRTYLTDVGWGGDCPRAPIEVADGAFISTRLGPTHMEHHRVRAGLYASSSPQGMSHCSPHRGFYLQFCTHPTDSPEDPAYKDIYYFQLVPYYMADYVVGSFFVSFNPHGYLKKTLIVARPTPTGRKALTLNRENEGDGELRMGRVRTRDQGEVTDSVVHPDAIVGVIADMFGVDVGQYLCGAETA